MPSYRQNWNGATSDWALPTTGFSVGTPGLTSSPDALQAAAVTGAGSILLKAAAEASADGKATIYLKPDFSNGCILGIAARDQGSSQTYQADASYATYVLLGVSGTAGIFLERTPGSGGAEANLATAYNFANDLTHTYMMEFRLQGSSVKVRFYDRTAGLWVHPDGTLSATPLEAFDVTDATIAGAGRFGIINKSGAGTSQVGDWFNESTDPVVDQATLSLTAGGATGTLTAQGFSDPLAGVTWTSSDPTVATVDPGTGVVTPVGAGTCTVTATGVADTGQTATGAVTVASSGGGSYPTVSQIAAAVWAYLLGTPGAGSAAAALKAASDALAGSEITPVESGTARGGAASAVTLAASASTVDLSANGGCWVYIKAGPGCGQQARITGFDASSRVAQVTPPWLPGSVPDATSTYDIMGPLPDAVVGTVKDKTGYTLGAFGFAVTVTANGLDAALDAPNAIDGGSIRQALRATAAEAAGNIIEVANGDGTTSTTIKAFMAPSTARITSVESADGLTRTVTVL